MPENALSKRLQDFIARHVHSVEQIEILCLLARRPDESLLVPAIFQAIQTNETSITARLKNFVSARLVSETESGYRLLPEYGPVVRELAEAYHQRRVTVIELIYKRPTSSIDDFSEAFRLKRKD